MGSNSVLNIVSRRAKKEGTGLCRTGEEKEEYLTRRKESDDVKWFGLQKYEREAGASASGIKATGRSAGGWLNSVPMPPLCAYERITTRGVDVIFNNILYFGAKELSLTNINVNNAFPRVGSDGGGAVLVGVFVDRLSRRVVVEWIWI